MLMPVKPSRCFRVVDETEFGIVQTLPPTHRSHTAAAAEKLSERLHTAVTVSTGFQQLSARSVLHLSCDINVIQQ